MNTHSPANILYILRLDIIYENGHLVATKLREKKCLKKAVDVIKDHMEAHLGRVSGYVRRQIVNFQVPVTQPFKTLILHARRRTSRTLSLFFFSL